jgi:AcrR family transcriptional regulator
MDRHNARVRARVLDAWEDVLSESGFEETTVAAVATRAGLARSSVYRHFPDKESLFFEYIEDRVGAFVEALRSDIADEPNAASRLRRLVVGELYRYADAPAVGLSDVPESLSREGRARLRACFEPLRQLVRDTLEEGARDGTLGAIEIDNAIEVVFACIDVFRVRLARQWVEPDDIADDIADFVLRGLGAPRTGARTARRHRADAQAASEAQRSSADLPGR